MYMVSCRFLYEAGRLLITLVQGYSNENGLIIFGSSKSRLAK